MNGLISNTVFFMYWGGGSLFFKGSVRPISGAHLQVVSSDSSRNHSVLFTVVVPPKLGRLLRRLPDNSTQDVSTFWQSMVLPGCVGQCGCGRRR